MHSWKSPNVPALAKIEALPPSVEKLNKWVTFSSLLASVPLSYLLANLISIPALAALLLLWLGIGLYVGYEIKSFPSRKINRDKAFLKIERRNEQENIEYQNRFVIYEQKKKDHEWKKSQFLMPEKIAEFQNLLIMDLLKQTITFDGSGSTAKVGASEREFEKYLRKYFPTQRMKTKLTLKIPDFPYPYTPDFSYIDPFSQLHIDIEIDEPYTYYDGKPTHYLYSDSDNRRNNYFLARGWVVIRFAEEQIVRYPDECCKFIAEVIHTLGDDSFVAKFSGVRDVRQIGQWTEMEAIQMAKEKSREKYL
jgi:hypothetical protein